MFVGCLFLLCVVDRLLSDVCCWLFCVVCCLLVFRYFFVVCSLLVVFCVLTLFVASCVLCVVFCVLLVVSGWLLAGDWLVRVCCFLSCVRELFVYVVL